MADTESEVGAGEAEGADLSSKALSESKSSPSDGKNLGRLGSRAEGTGEEEELEI